MNSICDILVFKTPYESEWVFSEKFKKILEMFDTYVINSWIELVIKNSKNEIYDIYEYSNETLDLKIIFSIQKNIDKRNYFPVWMVNYYINQFKFEKSNIESFLNDNIKFIYNVFFSDFFVDYDFNKYNLYDYNKWKKLDYKNLNKFDMDNLSDDKNKQLLDSMMYVYFNLVKNIFDIKNNSEYIENSFLKKDLERGFEAKLTLFKDRWDEIKHQLTINAVKIKEQIDLFISSLERL